MSNGAQQASGGATYRMLRELGSRSQHSFAALREPGDLVVVQRFVRADVAGAPREVAGATALDAQATALLLRDARCLAKNWHPNIARVKYVDLCVAPHRELTIASEMLDGTTLADLFAAAQRCRTSAHDPLLGISVLVRVILDVLAGLQAFHGLRDGMNVPVGAIHGELCPANVVVGKDGVGRLVNVLRARPVRVEHGSEAIGYAPPEAFEGEGTDDPRSDVYAVGAMLWEGLSGRRLYEERDPARILSRQREGEVSAPVIAEGSPFAGLSEVAMRALAFDPSLRFRGSGEMAAELRKIAGTRLATGTAVAALVGELGGERIRMRRAELDPASSGTRRRAGDAETLEDLGALAATLEMPIALIAAARPSTPRGVDQLLAEDVSLDDMDDDDLLGPRGSSPELALEAAIALANASGHVRRATPYERRSEVLPPAPPEAHPPHVVPAPFETSASPETTKQLISAALALTTSKMRAVAVERTVSAVVPPNPTPGDFVIPIDVTETLNEPAARRFGRARGVVLYALAGALVLGAMGAFVALRRAAEVHGGASPTFAAPPPPVTGDTGLPTAPTTPKARPTTGAGSPKTATSASARPTARPRAPAPGPAAPAKPKRSVYEPDGL